MDNPKNQIVDRVKEANNVLVTVSADPSVDQLAAAIGLTLLLNKLGKHATAVFSGQIPSTIEFLQPEATLESNTDSLRDFIIALDKSKADKLRYKVEDRMVKIFITPYRTSINQDDLEFSQGDFNVEVVIGLGVKVREDLDQAITAHGRILHDATVVTINNAEAGSLGTINWIDNQASSLSEMVVAMADLLKSNSIDEQMATALLTGIVAETERFSNAKTTSNTMAASAKLMAAGANQQLVATKLEEPEVPREPDEPDAGEGMDGTGDEVQEDTDGALHIEHEELPEPQPDSEEERSEEEEPADEETAEEDQPQISDSRLILEPPTMGGQLTANSEPEGLDPSVDPLSQPMNDQPILSHDSDAAPMPTPEDTGDASDEDNWVQKAPAEPTADNHDNETLTQIEESVDSPHLNQAGQTAEEAPVEPEVPATETTPDVDQARDAVQAAVEEAPEAPMEPIAALNAQPVDLDLGHEDQTEQQSDEPPAPPNVQIDPNGTLNYIDIPPNNVPPALEAPMPETPAPDNGLPTNLVPPMPGLPADPTAAPSVEDPTAPPPVPPPMMPPMMPPPPPSNASDQDDANQNPLMPPVM